MGEEIGNNLKSPRVLCFYGELGTGKTTFVQGFAKGLGITSRLLSPTFIIVRRYNIPDSAGFLYHLDLYRVEEKDLAELGVSDMLSDPDSIVVIEWAEKLGNWLPKDRVDITFSVLPNGNHEIRYQKGN
ncbi:tRNA (adenosine(37)-N6)-threonylcarbamoyltransferase complex ATPase subunit type 1 TsaE [Candidatus Gottesmanbacteria bacterium RIFCSPHIGHO2_01_FULL_46_14]|uniref:tRNA threonylcarbamoyladenosine biosynthesis protein TsaE n=3 Tax=Candidatus Gottesmaniibacteriota TaxID=1752720 RepID=A0A1F5ZQH8_9BACT|nr:MAG: ATP/GTP hydrolase [Candidatus Gottesmanbacteria bacterium GW2011_GWA1_47_8]OGG14709.1 MAG: tRNA (adenosine(37)-N6)-threonylcarbamoyltransferase complex ATPase subunit type 1 TsaE [Candidatus Gottesmanbacteria bacterium RIFCSPHIGHO2_01_FULL_46_14]OGG29967.1 MAG: tRNA (adenosine(37)-N6)-threonylcarbamoyltransferase complex ATPase subunit type 1 TsaE [Candidatus Gottesmanbacteria bacterium RIFCSPLOWO2_01_FULL_46_21]